MNHSLHFKKLIVLSSFFLFSKVYADFKNDIPLEDINNTESSKNVHNSHQKYAPTNNDKQKQPTASSSKEKMPDKNSTPSPELGTHNSRAPVIFSGQFGEGSRKTGILNLEGNAVIMQDDTTLKSDKAKIYSIPGTLPTPGQSRVKRALAIGNVHILKKATPSAPEIKATADQAEFIALDRIIILKGKAKVWRVNEFLNGDTIKINLNSGDIEVQHPEGTFDPKSANSTYGNKTVEQQSSTPTQ